MIAEFTEPEGLLGETNWAGRIAGRIAALLLVNLVNYGWEWPRVPLRMAVKLLGKLQRP